MKNVLSDNSRWAFLTYLGILSFAGGIAVYLATSKLGPGVSTDAAVMLATAQNLVNGRGLINYSGQPLAQFGPLYSMLLALGSFVFRQDVFTIGWALSVISFSALIWFSGLYFFEAFKEAPLLAYFSSFIIFSSTSLVQIFANIASDPLFLLMTVFFLMCMTNYLRAGSAWSILAAAAVVIIACFQRYAGLSLAITGGLAVGYCRRDLRVNAILRGAAFTTLTAAPIILWGMLHNAPVSGSAFGSRLPALPLANLTAGLEKLLYWFIPLRIITLVGPLLLAGIIVGAVAAGLWITKSAATLRRLSRPEVLPNAIFLLVYGAVLVFNISYYELKGVSTDRVHIVLLPSLLIVMFVLGGPLFGAAMRGMNGRQAHRVATLLFLLWAIYPLSRTSDYVYRSMQDGDISSYNSINKGDIRSSALARYLGSLDISERSIYSNGSDSVWFILRTQVDPMPLIKTNHRLAYLAQHYAQWPGAGHEGYLIWFHSEAYKETYATPEELSSIAALKPLYSDDTADVYLVSAR